MRHSEYNKNLAELRHFFVYCRYFFFQGATLLAIFVEQIIHAVKIRYLFYL